MLALMAQKRSRFEPAPQSIICSYAPVNTTLYDQEMFHVMTVHDA